ncbi:MAG: uroporphyrinogen decarboxylase family protein [Promethearchaeota archaeon]
MGSCYGGSACDPQKLPFMTREQIYQEVRYNIKCLMSKGGYVAASVHNITSDVSAENIVALFDAIHKFGIYNNFK